jgi:4-amino-4-deoxy-L-arabinose transferase-like glycosyltransferase
LLSENLLIALLPVMFWLVLRSRDRRSPVLGWAAGVLAGLAFLTRPNLLLLGPAVAVLLLAYAPPRAAWRVTLPVVFALAFFATAALMPLRNHVASGTTRVPALTSTNDWASGSRTVRAPRLEPTLENVRTAANYYGRRILFTAGLLPAFVPEYRVRPHWLAAWGGALAFVWIAVRRRRLEFWQALAGCFVVAYLAPLIAVAMIHNYGFRMIVPALPAVILLAVYAGEQIIAVGQVRT